MKYLVDGKRMKEIDRYTIDEIGIPSMVLMEKAAQAAADEIRKAASSDDKILSICGMGNNGGDGVAAARILKEAGFHADVLLIGERCAASPQMKEQLKIAENLGIKIFNNIGISEYTIIVDAIFGIGLSKPVTGIYEDIIRQINEGEQKVYSIDIPSGISADTGGVFHIAVRADVTVTFGMLKTGLMVYPGAEYAGKVILADIGFPKIAKSHVNPVDFVYDMSDLKRLPARYNGSNKGTYGKILIIAGSRNMNGACYLSAKAAYRSGAGLVKILTAECNRTAIQTALPEVILSAYQSEEELTESERDGLIEDLRWASAVVIGPGIGKSAVSKELLQSVLKNAEVPVVIDADGLNLLCELDDYREPLRDGLSGSDQMGSFQLKLPRNVIITPHLKEMQRLVGLTVNSIQHDLPGTARKATQSGEFVLVLKDARTVVTDGTQVYINVSGNNGMSTGGSGDVLTGIIAAFAARGMILFEAAVLGTYIHGLAGDQACEKKGPYSMIASDIVEALSLVLR